MHEDTFKTPDAAKASGEGCDSLVDRARDITYCKRLRWITQTEFNRIMRRLKGNSKLGMKEVWFDVEDLGKPKTPRRVVVGETTVKGQTRREYRDVKLNTNYFNMDIYYTL